MKNKKIAILVLSALIAGVVISWTNANMFNITPEEKTEMQELFHKLKSWETLTVEEEKIIEEAKANFRGWWWKMKFKKGVNWMMKWLTEDEKIALEKMTDDEKTAFFENIRDKKQAEIEVKKVEREKHEAVIDKLIDWEELNSEEKLILEEIKIKRAERKKRREEIEENRKEAKILMNKKISWELLTEDEIEKLWESIIRNKRWYRYR